MMLEGIDTEVIELSPSPNNKLIGQPLQDIDFPVLAALTVFVGLSMGFSLIVSLIYGDGDTIAGVHGDHLEFG